MRSFESFAEQVTELDPRHYDLSEAKKESDRKDAMPKDDVGHDIHRRAVAQYNKQNPSKKVRVDEAAPIVAKLAAGAASKLAGKGIAKATAGQAAKGGLRKRAADYATRKGSEMAYDKVKEKLTDNGDVSEEVVQEDDMKGMSVKSGHKRSAKEGAGLTKKGVAAYRRKNPGSKLQTAVTTPPSKLDPDSKAAGRRRSFCARSKGWDGERGKAARRRWNCGYEMEGENMLSEFKFAPGKTMDIPGKVKNIKDAAGGAPESTADKVLSAASNIPKVGTAISMGAAIGNAYKNTNRAPAVSGRGAGRSTFNPNSSPGAKLDPK